MERERERGGVRSNVSVLGPIYQLEAVKKVLFCISILLTSAKNRFGKDIVSNRDWEPGLKRNRPGSIIFCIEFDDQDDGSDPSEKNTYPDRTFKVFFLLLSMMMTRSWSRTDCSITASDLFRNLSGFDSLKNPDLGSNFFKTLIRISLRDVYIESARGGKDSDPILHRNP